MSECADLYVPSLQKTLRPSTSLSFVCIITTMVDSVQSKDDCRSHFTEISIKSDEFVELYLDQVIEILNSNELNVKSEEAVFDAIIRWIDHKADERKSV